MTNVRHLALATVCAAAAASCGTKFKAIELVRLQFPDQKTVLPNGLRVVVQPDASQATVLLSLRYGVGSAFDPKDKAGLAHVIEHLTFRLDDELIEQSPPPRAEPGPIAAAMPAAAPSPADAKAPPAKAEAVRLVRYGVDENAYTTADETVFWKVVVPRHVEDVLASFAAQMGDFTSHLAPAVFAAEREVIHNERRQRYEGQPLARWPVDLVERMYPATHPYQGASTIGAHETIDAITLADVGAFLTAHYVPANATLSIVGPVDAAATMALVTKYFADKPRRAPSRLVAPNWTPTYREERVQVPQANAALVTVAWPAGPRFSDEAAALETVRGNVGGWVRYRLVTNRSWCYWTSTWMATGALESRFIVQALVRDPADVEAVRDSILAIADAVAGAVDHNGFVEARLRSPYNYLFAAQNRHERANAAGLFYEAQGEPMGWPQLFGQFAALKLDRERSVVSQTLARDRAFVLIHLPPPTTKAAGAAAEASFTAEQSSAAAEQSPVDRPLTTLPQRFAYAQSAADYLDWALAAVTRSAETLDFTLENGARCRIRRDGQLPIMAANVTFAGGGIAEPADLRGVGTIAAESVSLSGSAYRADRYSMSVRANYGSEDEAMVLTQTFPSFYAAHALRIFVDELEDPQFLRTNMVDERAAYLHSLADAERDLGSLGWRAYLRARGLVRPPPPATRKTVDAISLAAVKDYFDAVVFPENAIISVVSDRPVDEVRALLESSFGRWQAAGRKPIELDAPPAAPAPATRLVVVPRADSPQSLLAVAFSTPGWDDWQGYLKARAVAILLESNARRLREAQGVTYGVDTNVWAWKGSGVLQLSSKVERAATSSALAQLLRSIAESAAMEVTEGDLEHARRELMQEYAEPANNSTDKAAIMSRQTLRQRPRTYSRDVIRWLDTWTPQDLQAAMAALLKSEAIVVVVGEEPAADLPALAPYRGAAARYTPEELL
jgi:zinc protease